MKKIILTIVVLISNLSFGQHYNNVYIEKSMVDENNKSYSLGKEFALKIHISQKGKPTF